MILISVLNGVLYSTVFGNIGAEKLELPITADNAANNKKIQQNYIGLCFFACLDAFMTPSLFQIIQIPTLRPVFVREHTSKMYSASAYFISGWLSSIPVLIIYPFLTSGICFHFLGFTDESFDNFLRWLPMVNDSSHCNSARRDIRVYAWMHHGQDRHGNHCSESNAYVVSSWLRHVHQPEECHQLRYFPRSHQPLQIQHRTLDPRTPS